jgi:endonuclease/exonuclease/phosphatase family metal-dependent hydrolase
MRGRCLVVAGLCLIGLCLQTAASRAAAGSPRPLRYVTFNLFHGGAFSGLNGNTHDLDARLGIVAEELRALEVDVIGLQEASAGRRRGNVAARLAAELGFQHVYAPANPRLFNSDGFSRAMGALLNFSEGPAILSRFPVVAWEGYALPRCGRVFESRRLVSATLGTPWGALRAFSAHTLGDVCQTQAVVDLVRARRGLLPSVLMGDFNAVEESEAIAALTRNAGFIDAFRTANPRQPGLTVWQRMDETAPTVRRRVDYLFVVPGETAKGRVLSSRLVLDAPRTLPDGRTLWPSDHYGVMADLDVLARPSAEAETGQRSATDAGGGG